MRGLGVVVVEGDFGGGGRLCRRPCHSAAEGRVLLDIGCGGGGGGCVASVELSCGGCCGGGGGGGGGER